MVRDKHEAFELHCVGVEKDTKKSNSHHWTCKYCGKRYTSGTTRLLQHLTKLGGQVAACKEIPDHIASEIRQKMLGSPSTLPTSVRGYASHPSRASASTSSHEGESHFQDSNIGSSSQSPTQRDSQSHARQSGLGQAPGHVRSSLTWIKEKQKIADIELARTVIMENLSFNLLNSNQWKTMVKAISEVGPCQGWSGPSYSDMRTTKINEENKRIDLSLAPMREKWSRYGCTILSHGWRDRKNRGIIYILVSCPIGTFFLRVVEVGKKGKKTTGVFIYRHIKKAIEEVMQVVTDNASNCRHMGQLLEGEYPHIVWTPCATHCLDLLMEDIGKLSWVKACTLQASSIVTFFTQKVKVLAMFREHSKLEIKKPATTRFAYMWIVLSRLLEVKVPLRHTVESKSIQRLCLDESFWDSVKAILSVITPIYKVLCMTDCDGATLGLLIHIMRRAMEEIRECTLVTEDQRGEVLEITMRRWTWMHRPIHGFAGLLHPAFKSPQLYDDVEVLSDRLQYMSRVVPIHLHNDMLEQINCYMDERGNPAFLSPTCLDRESMVKPLFWWQNFGFSFTTLCTYALKVLSQDCSSGACERNWSAFALIHTKVRNRLSPEQMEKLIYCRTNLRMLQNIPNMETLKQVNVNRFWPSARDTPLPSYDVPQDDEELLFAELYRELCSIDVRQTRSRSSKGRVRGVLGRGKGLIIWRASTTSHGDGASSSRAPATTYTRRKGRRTLPSMPLSSRFDDEGNLVSDPPSPPSSTYEMTTSNSLDDDYDDSDIDEMEDVDDE
ncbi:hypothetical protein KP509_28G044500 [Ceratopteris richardii]|uniref:BED-type domain-containing protein n=1 Tax=Ceratopteris richardii TaxID=49495 RepID=A0A8T2RDV5_CERRI|nr:hypothetical protein KP509_28G044500 [Ceratopteris richardii]